MTQNELEIEINNALSNNERRGCVGWYVWDDCVKLDGTFNIQTLRDICNAVEKYLNTDK